MTNDQRPMTNNPVHLCAPAQDVAVSRTKADLEGPLRPIIPTICGIVTFYASASRQRSSL